MSSLVSPRRTHPSMAVCHARKSASLVGLGEIPNINVSLVHVVGTGVDAGPGAGSGAGPVVRKIASGTATRGLGSSVRYLSAAPRAASCTSAPDHIEGVAMLDRFRSLANFDVELVKGAAAGVFEEEGVPSDIMTDGSSKRTNGLVATVVPFG